MDGNRMKTTYTIRILAGGYLIYTAYSLIKGYAQGESTSIWILLAGIFFGVVGIGLMFFSIKGWTRCSKEVPENSEVPEIASQDEPEDTDSGESGQELLPGSEENQEEKEKTE